jgi:hypothetical protein
MKDIIENTTVPDKWLSVSSYDFYSGGTQLNVAGRERNQHCCGTIITLCIYGLMGLASWYFVSQFLDTEGPKIEYNFRTEPSSFKFNLKEVETNFFILLSNPDLIIQTKKVDDAMMGDSMMKEDPMMDESYSGDENPSDPSGSEPPCDPATDPMCVPPCDITVDPTCGGTICDPATDPNCCDPATDPFCRRRRRVLQTTEPKFPFLNLDNYGMYYAMALKYEIIEYKKTPTGASYQSMMAGTKDFIKCSEAAWFKNPDYQEALNQSPFARDLINDFGICFDVGNDLIIVGDNMSKKSSRLSFSLRECKAGVGNCFADATERIREAKDLYALIGSFEPAINNSNKEKPWDFGINTNHKVTIDSLVTAEANVYLKKLSTKTDWGMIIEQIKEEFKAAISHVRTEFQSKLTLGTTTGAPNEFDMKYLSKDSLLTVNYVASRQTEEVKRSYMTLLDLFGQIGGTIDFLIFIITLLFHWYENITSSLSMRKAISDKLKFPEKYSNKSNSTLSRVKTLFSKDKIDKKTEEAIDQMVEEALSVERMTEDAAIVSILKDTLYPKEVVALLPTVMLLKKRMAIEDEEKEKEMKKQSKSKKVDKSKGPIIQPNSGITSPQVEMREQNNEDANSQPKDLSLANAWNLISFDQSDSFAPVRKEVEKIITEFCSRQKITPEQLFAEKNEAKPKPQLISPDPTIKTELKSITKEPVTEQIGLSPSPPPAKTMARISL